MTELEVTQDKELFDIKLKRSKQVYVFAWIFEIIAAGIGLMVAILQIYDKSSTFADGNQLGYNAGQIVELILAGVPWIMVAIAEVLKIPLAFLVYSNKQLKVKIAFSILLIGITFLTFETLVAGFERNYRIIARAVKAPQEELVHLNQDINSIKNEIAKFEQTTPQSTENEIQILRDRAKSSYETDIANYDKLKNNLLLNLNQALNDSIENIEDSIARIKSNSTSQIKQLTNSLNAAIANEISSGNKIDEQNRKRIERKTKEIESLQARIALQNRKSIERKTKEIESLQARIDKVNIFQFGDKQIWIEEVSQLKKDIEKIENSKSREVDQLKKDIEKIENSAVKNRFKESDQLRQKISEVSALSLKNIRIKEIELGELRTEITKNNAATNEVDKINNNIKGRLIQYNKELAKIKIEEAELQANLLNKKESIEASKKLLKDTTNIARVKRIEIENEAERTQVYRIAAWWFNKKFASDVTSEEANTVAAWWWGSIALVVSTLGVSLAFGSFILRYSPKNIRHTSRKTRIPRVFFLLLKRLVKRMRNPKIVYKTREVPKEVIREVPVDKVVIKEVAVEVPVDRVEIKEIPVEVVRKEVIHVPIYTNDPDLIKFGTTKVKDIMKDE